MRGKAGIATTAALRTSYIRKPEAKKEGSDTTPLQNGNGDANRSSSSIRPDTFVPFNSTSGHIDIREGKHDGNVGFRENENPFLKIRLMIGEIVENPLFQNVVVVFIIINALMMGIGTFGFVKDNDSVRKVFDTIDTMFLIIFTIELGLQILHKGYRLFYQGWLVFDFIIIVASWTSENFQVIRAFRIFRALRLITRIKVLKNLVGALLNVLPRMAAITCLMGLIFYIFAVMFTSLFKELPENYFRRLDSSFFTLFQMMTLDWAEVARHLMKYKWWAWMPVISFIMISSFIVYNLIVAVICDAIFVLHDKKYENSGGGDENDASSTTSSDEDEFDALTLRRIDDLAKQVKMLQENQVEIQDYLESLAASLKNLDDVVEPAPQDITE